MPWDANQIRENIRGRFVNQLFVIFPVIKTSLILQSSERSNSILRKKRFWRRNPICRQFFGDPIECDAGAVRYLYLSFLKELNKYPIKSKKGTVELDVIVALECRQMLGLIKTSWTRTAGCTQRGMCQSEFTAPPPADLSTIGRAQQFLNWTKSRNMQAMCFFKYYGVLWMSKFWMKCCRNFIEI